MITKLEHNFTKNTKIYFEHNLEINENSYLIIFGHHINGGFIAIPDWNICCEASANSDKIDKAFNDAMVVYHVSELYDEAE